MKNKISFFFIFSLALQTMIGKAQTPDSLKGIILDGKYHGKNVYVQNPLDGTGKCCCTLKILVNGKVTEDSIRSGAFEIDLTRYNFKIGDRVKIQILHKDDCKPKVLLTERGKPKSTLDLISISIDTAGILKWKTKKEMGNIPFEIEQFRWNKWVKIGEVEGKGEMKENEYEFKVKPYSGENQFRIKQIDYTYGGPRYSGSIKFISSAAMVNIKTKDIIKEIEFSLETFYEIYDNKGKLVKSGTAKIVNCTDLPKGNYFLNYDNSTTEIKKL